MKKIRIIAVLILVTLFFMYQLIHFQMSIDWFSGIISAIMFLCTYLYNDSLFIFTGINRFIMRWFSKPEITWETNYSFQIKKDENISRIPEKIRDSVENIYKSNDLKEQDQGQDDSKYYHFSMHNPVNRTFDVSVQENLEDEEWIDVNLVTNCTVSFVNSEAELSKSEKLFRKLTDEFQVYDESKNDYEYLHGKIIKLSMIFLNKNPYYGMMLKRIDESDIKSFNLQLKKDNCSIEIKKHCLIIDNAGEIDDVKAILKSYLPLPDVI